MPLESITYIPMGASSETANTKFFLPLTVPVDEISGPEYNKIGREFAAYLNSIAKNGATDWEPYWSMRVFFRGL